MKEKFFFCILCFLIIISCQKQKDNFNPDFGKDYFPLEIGKYWEYQVDSVIYDPTSIPNKFESSIQFREEITDTLLDNNGEVLYRIERFERRTESDLWEIKNVFSQQVIGNQAFRIEDNLKYIKMVFPTQQGKNWDGNIFFEENLTIEVAGEPIEIFKSWDYRMLAEGQPDSVGVMNFEEVLEIEQADNENLIELRESTEKYAKGVGLVYREMRILDTQCINTNPDCEFDPWEEKAERGFILKQKIIDWN